MRHQKPTDFSRPSVTTSQTVFADKLACCTVANGVARLGFAELRIDPPHEGGNLPITSEAFVACVAVPWHALAEMHQQIGNLLLAASQPPGAGQPN